MGDDGVRPEDAGDVLERFLPASEFPGIVSVYLFGSAAEGRSHRESDVDVGVLFSRSMYPTRRDRFEAGLRVSSALIGVLGNDKIDVVVLNDVPPHLARRVVTSGRRLVCADSEGDHDFTRDVQLRAADIEPFLRRTRQLKLEAIAR
jgi:predicted nucleotidyltransferase